MKGLKSLKKLNKLCALVVVAALFVTASFAEFTPFSAVKTVEAKEIDNIPRYPVKNSGGVVTYECVYFGHFYQTKNKKTGEYFKEPIRWRVLEHKGDDLFLMADEVLEGLQYSETVTKPMTWENSNIRDWLNGYTNYDSDSFIKQAFSEDEREDIATTTVTPDQNLLYPKDDQGNATEDKVYLLSLMEVSDTNYGFLGRTEEDGMFIPPKDSQHTRVVDNARVGGDTEYALRAHKNSKGTALQINQYESNIGMSSNWWLRTTASSADSGMRTDFDGTINQTKVMNATNIGVRPVLHVSAKSEHVRYGGHFMSDGTEVINCGKEAVMEYNVKGNRLQILGSGPMYDFTDWEAPWHKYYDQIEVVQVMGNVTSIASHAFDDCLAVDYLFISDKVQEISKDAFGENEEYMLKDKLLISLREGSDVESQVRGYDWNYTTIYSPEPLALDIDHIEFEDIGEDHVTISFEKPVAGQSYRIYADRKLVMTVDDDSDYIDVPIDGGVHFIGVTPLVVGSKGIERTGTQIIRNVKAGTSYSEPYIDSDDHYITRWDCIYFGNYPQSLNSDGTFKTEKIKWRILKIEDIENEQGKTEEYYTLIADKALDNKPYNSTGNPNTIKWSNCTLRTWLNDELDADSFYNNAFDENEKAMVVDTTHNPNDKYQDLVTDKVWCLSQSDAENADYGFLPNNVDGNKIDKYSLSLSCMATPYCYSGKHYGQVWQNDFTRDTYRTVGKTNSSMKKYQEILNEYPEIQNTCIWWLCTPYQRTQANSSTMRLDHNGWITGKQVHNTNACVRPVIRIKAESEDLEDAGTVYSDGTATGPREVFKVYIDGALDREVKQGSEYVLPSEEVVQLRNSKKKASVEGENAEGYGYIDDESPEELYKPKESIIVNKDMYFDSIKSVTAETDGFALLLTQAQSGRGVSFYARLKINGEDPIFSSAFTYGALLTTENYYDSALDQQLDPSVVHYSGGAIDVSKNVYDVHYGEGQFVAGTGTRIKLALAGINPVNYTRRLVMKPYITLTYRDGTTRTIESENQMSIMSPKEAAQEKAKDSSYIKKLTKAYQKTAFNEMLNAE